MLPKGDYQAEAKTIRALMYINLTMTYQDVPFLTAPLTIDEAECERRTVQLLWLIL